MSKRVNLLQCVLNRHKAFTKTPTASLRKILNLPGDTLRHLHPSSL